MIELQNITKYYPTEHGKKYIFRDLSVVFPGGHSIGLMGRNGAGKSTLLRILGGIEAPDEGRVVCDESISWPVGLGGGFQGSLSARDNVRFVCRVFGAGKQETDRIIKYVEDSRNMEKDAVVAGFWRVDFAPPDCLVVFFMSLLKAKIRSCLYIRHKI